LDAKLAEKRKGRKGFNIVIARLRSSRGNLSREDNILLEIATSACGLLAMTAFYTWW